MKLIAIDMDGTLLSNDKQISKENLLAIQDATQKGHIVMICTGRPLESLQAFLKGYNLTLSFAVSNGAEIYAEDKLISSSPMDLTAVDQLYTYLEKNNYPFKLYTNHGIYTTKKGYSQLAETAIATVSENISRYTHMLNFIVKQEKEIPTTPLSSYEELQEKEGLRISKIFIFTPDLEKRKALDTFAHTFPSLLITSSDWDNLEINDKEGNKAHAVEKMAEHFRIPMENTVAIGDNFNDVPMLKVAGLSIAMANGAEEVKKLCDVVTLTNEEHGVAHAIRKYVLEEI